MGRPYAPDEWIRKEEFSKLSLSVERRGYALDMGTGSPDQAIVDHYRYTMALSALIPWIADAQGGIVDIDIRGLDHTGLAREDCLGSGFMAAIHPADRPIVKAAWTKSWNTGSPIDYEIRLRQRDDTFRWYRCRAAARLNLKGKILCWYGTIEDIHDSRAAQQALRYTAEHDGLTGLLNRHAFMSGLRRALLSADGTDIEVGLVLIDLDGFKLINDRYGHDAGDELLREVARRLQQVGYGEALAGRLGGDEFGIFIYTPDRSSFDDTIGALKRALAAPCVIKGQSHLCRVSIGVAIYPGHGKDADGLHKNADLALYEAKRAGGGVQYFESRMRSSLQIRLSELAVARRALDTDNVVPFYQPKVDLRSGEIVGFEALLRWTTGGDRLHSPDLIAAALEDVELAIALDERILRCVARDVAGWKKHYLHIGRIAVNVSAAGFRQPDFADRVLECCARAGINPSDLEIEVTERVFLEPGSGSVIRSFERLRNAGMTIALDDFGTGYASLVHLKQFPVDSIKIDRSFVQSLDDRANAAIVQAITDLGGRLGISTVAEGVDTVEQATALRAAGCVLAQGYLFSRALPASDVGAFIGSATRFDPIYQMPRDHERSLYSSARGPYPCTQACLDRRGERRTQPGDSLIPLLGARISRALQSAGVASLSQLKALPASTIAGIPGIGKASQAVIRSALQA